MLHKLEYRNSNNTDGDSNNGQLLRDIEEISKALYLHKSSSGNARSKSAGRVRLSESKSNLNQRISRADSLHKDKKSSSAWNWKKPLKALAHIGDKKFHCRFYLHAHSIEGLPGNFEDLSLCVQWKRKNEMVQTSSSKVSRGVAEFEETLITRCSVYGSNGGPNHPVKYESKHFLVYPSVVEAPGLDIGKQWVDLTSFLPRSLEELEGEKSRGQWNTSFNLSGKAKGASLNVSFGFWVRRDKLPDSNSYSEFPELLNTVKSNRSSLENGNGVTGTLNYGSGLIRGSLDVKLCREVLLRTGLELTSSINCLYQKLDEGSLHISDATDSQQPEEHKAKLDLGFISAEEIDGYDWDITELSITEVGTETSEYEHLVLDQAAIERIGVDEMRKCDSVDCDSKSEGVMVAQKGEMQNSTKGLTIEETGSVFDSWTSESADGKPPIGSNECVEPKTPMDAKAKYKRSRSARRSLSLDAVAKSVASDFFKMLGIDSGSFRASSDRDLESPRELLLREFEEEALALGHFAFDFDAKHEEYRIPRRIFPGLVEESELSLVIYDSEEESKRVGGELIMRRNAKILEDLETEALMRVWGLNENDFGHSPSANSGGFGSPIEIPPEEIRPRPPLEEGFGSFVEIKNGGFLRSMNPSLFRNAINGGNLIIQVSNPAVLPAKMGFDVMEIVQNLALVGAEALYEKIDKLVPLEDITGKTIKQVASNAVAEDSASDLRKAINDLDSDCYLVDGAPLECSSLKDLSPLVVSKVEGLFLEGLKIQSRMSSNEPPPCIIPQSESKSKAITDLVSLSMTLDEWLSLEAGNTSDTLSKILIDHRAMGNELTISHLVQHLNPFRNHEPVGSPMLLLIQVQRAEEARYRAIRAHLAGVRLSSTDDEKLWGASAQQQSGARWLLLSGLARTTVPGFALKSKSMVGPSRLGFSGSLPRDILWSVSSNMRGASWDRNPDVVFAFSS